MLGNACVSENVNNELVLTYPAAWTAINKLSIIWKSDLSDKI